MLRLIYFAAMLCLSTQPAAAQDEVDFGRQQIEQVAEGVWLMRQPNRVWANVIGNVTIIEQADGLVVVDATGNYSDGLILANAIERISDKPVTDLVFTHWHNDHTLGAGALVDRWPGLIVHATPATRNSLATIFGDRLPQHGPRPRTAAGLNQLMAYVLSLGERARDVSLDPAVREGWAIEARYMQSYLDDPTGSYLVLPDSLIADSLVLEDELRPVELAYLGRANTDGDLIAWLPGQRILVSGDIVVAPTPYGFGSFPTDWITTIAALRTREPTILIPGHGAPQSDASYLSKLERALATVREQVQPLAEAGADLEDTRRQVDLAELTQLFAGDDPWAALALQRYFLEPIVEAAWREANGLSTTQQMVN